MIEALREDLVEHPGLRKLPVDRLHGGNTIQLGHLPVGDDRIVMPALRSQIAYFFQRLQAGGRGINLPAPGQYGFGELIAAGHIVVYDQQVQFGALLALTLVMHIIGASG